MTVGLQLDISKRPNSLQGQVKMPLLDGGLLVQGKEMRQLTGQLGQIRLTLAGKIHPLLIKKPARRKTQRLRLQIKPGQPPAFRRMAGALKAKQQLRKSGMVRPQQSAVQGQLTERAVALQFDLISPGHAQTAGGVQYAVSTGHPWQMIGSQLQQRFQV